MISIKKTVTITLEGDNPLETLVDICELAMRHIARFNRDTGFTEQQHAAIEALNQEIRSL